MSRALENFKKVERLNDQNLFKNLIFEKNLEPEDQLDAHEKIYQTALDLIIEWLEELEPPVSPNRSLQTEQSFSRSETALSVKHLLPIKLPPFSGNFTEWESFRDRFTALITENKDLSDFSQMHFLVSSLTGSA
ncbi:uncharacterized protein LOC115243210 [Formica exsecta]|uniref:uncharacterized protein LOC115243210 n=1 Tax=Formica exsecta TaxID=72781 RepID=UPI00114427CF|nr:uncharacterized protein LOC115243210 [Formica exsecta]